MGQLAACFPLFQGSKISHGVAPEPRVGRSSFSLWPSTEHTQLQLTLTGGLKCKRAPVLPL